MIEVESITKRYGSLVAIKDVSFTVEKGEIVGFLGPNGAGKTTTLKIITCYMPPSEGRVKVDGIDCFEDSLAVRKRLGYLPESVPLYREMTVRRFLSFVAESKGVEPKKRQKEIERVAYTCGLSKVTNRIIGHLSKGYRQRVGIAQALINDPPILIFDEPTIGLDPSQIIEIRQLIKDLGEEKTIILSSHILPEVSQVCQKVIIINKGKVIATETPANLTSQLQKSTKIVLQVKSDSQPIDSIIERLNNIPGVLKVNREDHNGTLIVETDQTKDLRPQISRTVIENNWDLLEIKLHDFSLEDIFLELVTKEEEAS